MRAVLLALLVSACSVVPQEALSQVPAPAPPAPAAAPSTTTTSLPEPVIQAVAGEASEPERFATLRIALVGDVMLGRSVAAVVDADGESIFREVRHILSGADIAAGNLESPLTLRPHISSNPYRLEADPASARLLRQAGFDVMSIANNHAGDAGRASIVDSIMALEASEIIAVGGGLDAASAHEPQVVETEGISIGFLAYDQSRAGTPASASAPGISHWHSEDSPEAIGDLAASVDVVVVSLHGGTEYSLVADRYLSEVAAAAVEAGASIVWGHGPHIVQPVETIGRALVATSLGNFVFDQPFPGTFEGVILEALVSAEGVSAYKLTKTRHRDMRVRPVEVVAPIGDAVFVAGEWWTMANPPVLPAVARPALDGFPWGNVIDAGLGDLDADGEEELVVAFTRPFIPNLVNQLWSEHPWIDAEGETTHLGVFRPGGFRKVWVAGSVPYPIEGLLVCGSTVGVVRPDGISAWQWRDFGFVASPLLPGFRTAGCMDVDGDGRTDLVGRPN